MRMQELQAKLESPEELLSVDTCEHIKKLCNCACLHLVCSPNSNDSHLNG